MKLDASNDFDVMSEINMTPLVDVMLVLLIIFIVTMPALNHTVKLELPHAVNQPNDTKPVHVDVSVDAVGVVSWNGAVLSKTDWAKQFQTAAHQQPQPEIHLRADRATPYEPIAQVMAAAQSAGMTKMGFITDPKQISK